MAYNSGFKLTATLFTAATAASAATQTRTMQQFRVFGLHGREECFRKQLGASVQKKVEKLEIEESFNLRYN